ncbi:hypothetical protein [Streptomyces sp. NPDC048603]|uniref:hypothetical protein n=1 Tax=Streptomyces sp. NPDC048603 TaxID=3365577 RepID=UPI00371701E0
MSAHPAPRRAARIRAVLTALLLLALSAGPAAAAPRSPAAPAAPAAPAVPAEGKAAAELSLKEAATGTEVTVSGTGWPAGTVVMLLLCGQNMIGGTNSCANDAGQAASVGADGTFRKGLGVVAPPKPCPCVVNVTSVNGDQSTVSLPFTVTGHPVAELPAESGQARLALLTGVQLKGEDGVLTWFGAPPSRRFTVTVGNLGSAPVKDPVFQIGTAHGVFAPVWEERQWKGTIPPGQKARVELDVELTMGAHGDYSISLKYGDKVLAVQPWGVDRPYGVLLFWGLLFVVVPAAVFRIGMAVVDRVRPRTGTGRPALAATGRHRAADAPPGTPPTPRGGASPQTATAVLPWFTPAQPADPSAPSDHPTRKGQL